MSTNLIINNLYVFSNDELHFVYIINNRVYSATDLEFDDIEVEDVMRSGGLIPPFTINTTGSKLIAVTLAQNMFTDVMIYQQDMNGRLIALIPMPQGFNIIRNVGVFEVPLPNGQILNETDNFPSLNLREIDESLVQQLENMINVDFPNGINDEVFDRILNITSSPQPDPSSGRSIFQTTMTGQRSEYLHMNFTEKQ